ncbi:MAG TPA: RecX family transcriptional regulator [Anaerolineales bacterium]
MDHKITALTLQKRNRQRVNVYLDGEFAFGLARIVAAWLEVGQTLSDEKIVQLRSEDGSEAAYQQALKLLNYRPRAEAEIRKNLKEHDIAEEIISEVLERLKENGLVDDARFAQAWIENRSELRPRSRRALTYELQQRGIDRQLAEQSLESLNDEELAYQAALKQSRKLRELDWQDFRQKMYGFLARRGFNYEVSAPVTARIWAELHNNGTSEEPLADHPFDEEVDL